MNKRLQLLLLVLALTFGASACAGHGTYEIQYQRNLHSISLGQGYSGSYFLATGAYQSQEFYRFTEIPDDGLKYTLKVPISELVYTDDAEVPYVIYWECVVPAFGDSCITDDLPESLRSFAKNHDLYISAYYEVHIPPGSDVPVINMSGDVQ